MDKGKVMCEQWEEQSTELLALTSLFWTPKHWTGYSEHKGRKCNTWSSLSKAYSLVTSDVIYAAFTCTESTHTYKRHREYKDK